MRREGARSGRGIGDVIFGRRDGRCQSAAGAAVVVVVVAVPYMVRPPPSAAAAAAAAQPGAVGRSSAGCPCRPARELSHGGFACSTTARRRRGWSVRRCRNQNRSRSRSQGRSRSRSRGRSQSRSQSRSRSRSCGCVRFRPRSRRRSCPPRCRSVVVVAVAAVLSVPSERAGGRAPLQPRPTPTSLPLRPPSLSPPPPALASGVARRPDDHKTHISPHNLSFYDGIKGLMWAINRIDP